MEGQRKKKKTKRKNLTDRNKSVVTERGRRVKGLSGYRRRIDLGGEHTMQCTDHALWGCAPEMCNFVTPVNSVKRKMNECIQSRGKQMNDSGGSVSHQETLAVTTPWTDGCILEQGQETKV